MGTRRDYCRRADECRQLAEEATPRDRLLLLEIAETWLTLAKLTPDGDDNLLANDPGKYLHS